MPKGGILNNMSDMLSILIKAKLNSSAKEIQDQLRILEKELDKNITGKLAVKLKIDASDLKIVTEQVEKVTKGGGKSPKIKLFDENEIARVQKLIDSQFANIKSKYGNKSWFDTSETKKKLNELNNELKNINTGNFNSKDLKEFRSEITKLKSDLSTLNNLDKNNQQVLNNSVAFQKQKTIEMNRAHQEALKMNAKFDAGKSIPQTSAIGNTQNIEKQISSIDKLILRFKAGKIGYKEFDEYATKIASSSNFNNKPLEQQIKLTQAITTAEKEHTKSLNDKKIVIDRIHAEAIKMNSQYDKEKIQTPQNNVYNQIENSLSRIYGIKQKLLKADEQEKIVLQDQLRIEAQKYATLSSQKLNSIGKDSQREIQLAEQKIALQNRLETASAKHTDRQSRNDEQAIQRREQLEMTRMNRVHAEAIRLNNQFNSTSTRNVNGSDTVQNFINQQNTRLSNMLGGSAGNHIDPRQATAIREQLQALQGLSTVMPGVRNQMASITTAMQRMNGEAQNASRSSLNLGESLRQAFVKFPLWIGVSTIFMQLINGVREAIVYTKEFDDATVNLTKVVDLAKTEILEMQQAAIDMGKSLGQSSTEVMKAFAEFGRIVKTKEEIQELTKSALVASNVTSLTAEEAAKSLSTVMVAFKKNTTDTISVIDQWNEIQNNMKVRAEDLSDSISKVGASAKSAGMGIEDLNSITAAMIETTGMSGSEIGTAINYSGLVA